MKKLLLLVAVVGIKFDGILASGANILHRAGEYISPEQREAVRKGIAKHRLPLVGKLGEDVKRSLRTGESMPDVSHLSADELEFMSYLLAPWIESSLVKDHTLPAWLSYIDQRVGRRSFTNHTNEYAKQWLDQNKQGSTDQSFVDKHYQGVAHLLSKHMGGYRFAPDKEIDSRIIAHIHGKVLCVDPSNIRMIAEKELDLDVHEKGEGYLPKDTLQYSSSDTNQAVQADIYISVHATDLRLQDPEFTRILNEIFLHKPYVILIVNFDNNQQTDRFDNMYSNRCVPSYVRKIIIVGQNIDQIGDGFLRYCSGLTSLDLSSLSRVTQVGYAFLYRCSGLTSLDLSFLSKVTRIEASFLCYCSGLTSLDLSPLSKVTRIEEGFLGGSSGLRSLDLSPLSNVTQIGNSFLYGCSGLISLDLSPLSKVVQMGYYFFEGCSSLQQIIKPMQGVLSVYDYKEINPGIKVVTK